MKEQYVTVEWMPSMRGRLRSIRIGRRSLGYLLGVGLLLLLGAGALFSSYLQMSRKTSRYAELRQNFDELRRRDEALQRVASRRKEQIASLQKLAAEVSVRYGITPRKSPSKSMISEIRGNQAMKPTVADTIQTYNFLKSATVSEIYHRYAFQWQVHTRPSLWPVHGRLTSPFGGRPDPFSGEDAGQSEFHTGVDIAAPKGTPVHVAADGVVTNASWESGYGKLVIVDHGHGIETYYAHLSEFLVVPGEEVRAGEVIALSGGTGRATAPHLHYEVRIHGTPVNPWPYLHQTHVAKVHTSRHNDLGL